MVTRINTSSDNNTELQQQFIICNSRLSAILHHSPIALAFTDLDLTVLKTNKQFFQQFGYNEDLNSFCNLLTKVSEFVF